MDGNGDIILRKISKIEKRNGHIFSIMWKPKIKKGKKTGVGVV